MRTHTLYGLLLLGIQFQVIAQPKPTTYVTVYNDNLGVVRSLRSFDIPKGISQVSMRDVAAQLNPSTVKINFRGTVLEQNYQYDLVSTDKILQRFIDKEVKLVDEKGDMISGVLLSSQGNSAVLQQNQGGVLMIPNLSRYRISVDQLPGGLITRPTLIWTVQSDRAGKQDVEISYQTSGLSWQTEYVAILKENDTKMEINAWVNLSNNSGATYEQAVLKLVAGSVNRVSESDRYIPERALDMVMAVERQPKAFDTQGLFEYHLYTLQRPVTLSNNENKQISLFEAQNVATTKRFIYSGSGVSGSTQLEPLNVFVEFDNTAAQGLGIPMPKGVIRVHQKTGESVEFIGEDNLRHTPKEEKIKLRLGQAFDILGETTLVSQRRISDKVNEYTYKVSVKNRKDVAVNVEVERTLFGNWEIIQKSQDFRKVNANMIVFDLPIGVNKEKFITYTIRITN
jgi:hypothetical protein